MKHVSFCRAMVCVAVLVIVAGCSSSNRQLFDQVGGMSRVNTLAERFVGNLSADGRTTSWLSGQDLPRLTSKVADQLCAVTGGECQPPVTTEQIAAGARKFDTATADAIVNNFSRAVASLEANAEVTSTFNNDVAPKMPGVLGALLN